MEIHVETEVTAPAPAHDGVQIRMLGPLSVKRAGLQLELPSSRKVRGLLAYLAMAQHPVGRPRLCELLWDIPNDPRGELRWCLSKLRNLLDEPQRRRIDTSGDLVSLDLEGCDVDAAQVSTALAEGLETLTVSRLRSLCTLFAGDFLEGLSIDRSTLFENWLVSQRRWASACRVAILAHLVERLPEASDEVFPYLEKWVELAPFDERSHAGLLQAMARRGRIHDCEEHLAAAARSFAAAELDFAPVRNAWREMRQRPIAVTSPHSSKARSDIFPVAPSAIAGGETGAQTGDGVSPRRASLAVMPFLEQGGASAARGGFADGLTHDIITRLARLRDMFVIARGSVFALAERGIGPQEAARQLNVDYVANGTVSTSGGRIKVSVELVDAGSLRIVLDETFESNLDAAFEVLDEIGDRIVASISSEIEMAERHRAILKPPSSLNAWEAYHRGLWHMYRFTRDENARARHFFDMAIRLDPGFARAHAGLSFTHWQNAFQNWEDREQETALALNAASQSLFVDDHNPAAHWAMGRALWLKGNDQESLDELTRAVDLSPNFALGHYALSFVHAQTGDPASAIASADHSRKLSPFDPLLFGMLGTRALALFRLGEFEEAAEWGLKAAGRPNAHPNIHAIAAHCLAMAGRIEEARAVAAKIRTLIPDYGIADFLRAFQFSPDDADRFRNSAKRMGLA